MACKVNVGMQGRIDATRLFNSRLFGLLLVKANITRALWDRQLMIYHVGVTANTDMALSEILTSIKDEKDTPSQEAPIGYALIGWHVDDGTGVACCVGWVLDPSKNRVIQYLKGMIETIYATTMTGWHGRKALGFTLHLQDRRVNMSAPDAVSQLAKELLSGSVNVAPKHAMTKDFKGIAPCEVPEEGDPARSGVLARMSSTRHGLGVSIWLQLAYLEIARGTNELCRNMAFPSDETHKCLCYQTMYLVAHGRGISYGPCTFGSLERHDSLEVTNPLGHDRDNADKLSIHHWFSDANLDTGSITGGIGMLAKGPIAAASQNQHLASPDAHTSEVVAASSNLNFLVPCNGVLQEIHIRLGTKTPFYLDSMTTVFVSKTDTAIKKSVWLIRRAAVLEDGVVNGEIEPFHISEKDMVADPFTKYLPYAVWIRHMHYVLNYVGDLPPRPK
jgi:hypothetical protein